MPQSVVLLEDDFYLRGVRLYVPWCDETDHAAELTRESVPLYTAEQLAAGSEGNTGHASTVWLRSERRASDRSVRQASRLDLVFEAVFANPSIYAGERIL
jgi:hypothetical protein